MTSTEPVFIVGVARSGTSPVYRALQHHSSFTPTRSRDGYDLTETRVFLAPQSVRANSSNAFRYMLNDAACHDAFLRAIRHIPSPLGALYTRGVVQRAIRHSNAVRAGWWRLCRNHHLLQIYFRHAAQARGAARLVEKTPDHVRQIPELWATFPNARVVFTYRHPLDVYASYKRRLQAGLASNTADAAAINWLSRIRPDSFCKSYQTAVEMASQHADARPKQLMMLSYESFTNDPHEAFKRICDFLEEPYQPACVERDAPGLSYWKQDPLLAQRISPNTSNWQSFVEAAEGRQIETSLAALMAQLGYAARMAPATTVTP